MTPNDIKALRARLGDTQAQFARRIGVSRQAINQLERGATKPSTLMLATLRRIEHAANEAAA